MISRGAVCLNVRVFGRVCVCIISTCMDSVCNVVRIHRVKWKESRAHSCSNDSYLDFAKA